MKSKLLLSINDVSKFKEYINTAFPYSHINYTKFSDTWTITCKGVKHIISYYEDRESKVKSELVIAPKGLTIMLVAIGMVFLIVAVLNNIYGWGIDVWYLFIAYVILGYPVEWIFKKIYPKHEESVLNEHQRLLNAISIYQD